MTEEQKNCEYCHFDRRGADFADDDAGCHFQLAKVRGVGYYINVWGRIREEDFDVESEYIGYCPMCGRDLKEED